MKAVVAWALPPVRLGLGLLAPTVASKCCLEVLSPIVWYWVLARRLVDLAELGLPSWAGLWLG